MLVLDGVQRGFDFEGRRKKNPHEAKQNRHLQPVTAPPRPPAPPHALYLVGFLLPAHVGELSSGSLELGVSGPVKLDPSDDEWCPGAVQQVLQRTGSGAPRRDPRIDIGGVFFSERAGASRTRVPT